MIPLLASGLLNGLEALGGASSSLLGGTSGTSSLSGLFNSLTGSSSGTGSTSSATSASSATQATGTTLPSLSDSLQGWLLQQQEGVATDALPNSVG